MLTVKHLEIDGHETVITAKKVQYCPPGMGNAGPGILPNITSRASVYAFDADFWSVTVKPNEGYNKYTTGVVYVMNENGSTVAKYNLDLPYPA